MRLSFMVFICRETIKDIPFVDNEYVMLPNDIQVIAGCSGSIIVYSFCILFIFQLQT